MKTMRAVTLKAYGAVNMLGIGQVPEPAFSRPNDVLIKVVAAGVNRADISQRRGHYPPPPGVSELLGLEVSGVVLRVGSNVKRFGEGDRVMALLAGGGYADLVVAHEGSVMKIPDEYSFVEAAAIPEGFLTAWQLLRRHGSLKKGQCVLVHAGASGVGTSLMQLAGKYFGAKVVATCSEGKVDFCKKFADIVVDRSPDEMGRCFCHKVKSAVGEDAVNLVVDPVVGGSYLNEDGIVLAQDGKIVVIALMGGSKVELNISTLLRKRGTIVFSKLRDQTDEYKASLVEEFEREVIPYLKDRIITPIVQRTFAMEDVAEAHIFMEGNMTNGKVILTMCDSTGE
ncbi:oxidoreductase [Trypanosoma brucei equiperdum]|uniref:Oxidoreductase n=1 Tax=Trypanosoma brucei equiperdum TaxID=630700 RepID=A0A3L6LB90_9TRYP|nr:oxidoreductase [Trypanosoma brucei equiperdum]